MPSEKNLSLSKWLPWQNRLQPTFLVDHSKQTINFVEMVQFLELQEALDPNEDNYGQEMEMFLNDADILKPGQQEEDGGNIRQFFVTSDGKGKQIQKKRSLLNVNKPRRSDQLPDFEAFVLSGESDEELPAIFDKNDNGAINNTDVIIKSYKNLSFKEHSNGNKSVKKNRKKRNSSGNSSIVEVIADTDVNDFIEHVDNLSVINEETQENSQDRTVISMVKTDTEQVEMEQESISSIVQSSDFKINTWSISEGVLRECENFTQLLPTFFSFPSCANVTSDTTDINKYECTVPDAPSLNELDVLVESISHMTTLPEIDMAKLVWEWEKEKKENANGRVETFKACLKDQISLANTVGNAGNRSTAKPELQHKTPKENSENKFDNSSINNNKARNIQPSRLSLFCSDNKSFNISSDFESPIKLTHKITSCNVSSEFESPSVKAMKENINMEVSVVNPDNIKRNPVSPKCDEDNTEMEVEPFSDSDDSFLDTQANFMLTNYELLADISCDESNHESLENSNVDHSNKHGTKDVIDKHHTDKPGGSSARPNAPDFSSSDLCKSADSSLFDDSFMNSSVFEAVKTPAVKHQSQSESPELMGRSTPTQFTFTQALACVHDSDSMDRVLVTSSTSDAKGLSPKREVYNEGHFTLIKKLQIKRVDEKINFTKNEECENSSFVKKQQHNDNSLNRSQCDLINDMFNVDNNADFSDAEEETEMPLFDLGFDMDDEIIPPSPCLSQTVSQKSILKNLNQSVLSSRKSLSFSCDKSKIYEDKNRKSIKPVLTPTTEEIEYDHENKDDSKIEEPVSQGFHISQDQTTENVPEVLNISKCAHETTVNKEQTKMEDDDDQQMGHMFLHDDFNVDDLQDDFEMIPTSPVLSGKRPSSQRQVTLPDDALESPVDAKNKSVATSVDSPSLDDSFVVRKKRRKALIIDSPVMPHCQEKEEFDDFKTPLRPVNLKNKQKFSTSSSEEESILRKKKCAKSVSFLIDEFDDDFENEAVSSETKKQNSNPVTIKDVKISSGNKKRKSKSPANPFLIDEAEVSEDEEVSTDEEDGSDMEHMEDSFVSEGCTQLSQGQHEELHAIYLKSVRSPAIQGGRFKLKYDYDDNIDVYSQVPQDEESQYNDDSFVDDDVEEHTLLDGHEITILDKDNILDNDSYIGPRTRWSKPARREKVIKAQKTKKKRVKRITDSSSEDEGKVHSKSVISPEHGSKHLLLSPEISVNPARSNIRNRKQLIISSDEEQDTNQESDSSEIMCSLKTRIANKYKTVDSSSSDHSDTNSQVSSLKEKEERIIRQKEKQEEFKRILAAKQNRKNVELTGSNSSKPPAKVHDNTTNVVFTGSNSSKPSAKVHDNTTNVVLIGSNSSKPSAKVHDNTTNVVLTGSNSSKPSAKVHDNTTNVVLIGSNSSKPSAKVHDNITFSEDPQLTDDNDLLLNTTRHNESKPVIIVDSREINGAQDIVSALRFQHDVNVIAAQLDSCDYVVSVRMGIDRKQWAEFSNGSNRAKMTERVQEMCDFYDRPCVIIEKDKIKGEEKSRVLHWTKYVDKTLVQLIQSKVTLFFTENQTETASIIAGLCQLESRKNCAISCPINLSAEQQNRVKFYRSIPHLSYIHCLFLCNNFMTVAKFLCSDINTIMEKGKMTMERATEVYNYIKRMFDTQMLPSSYG